MAMPNDFADVLMGADNSTISPVKRQREAEGPSGSTQVQPAPCHMPRSLHTIHRTHKHNIQTHTKKTRSKVTGLHRAGPHHGAHLSLDAPESILRSTGESQKNTPPKISAMAHKSQK
jgi:hypothetical protein